MNKTKTEYEISRDMISKEIEEFNFYPRGFVESMGWRYIEKHIIIADRMRVKFDHEDVQKIVDMSDCERKEAVTNMVAEKIRMAVKNL